MTAAIVPPLGDTSVYLVVARGAHRGSMIPVKGPQFLIGKHAACHMRPSSTAVSNHHCGLLQREGRTFLCDLNSATGTYLNDRQVVGEVEVLDQDRLRIGPLEFVIRLAGAPAAGAAEPPPAEEPANLGAPEEPANVGADEPANLDAQEVEPTSDTAAAPDDSDTAPIPMDDSVADLTTSASAEDEAGAETPPPSAVAAADTPSHRARAILRRYGKHRRKD